ncbi:acetyltransferase [Pontibacter sp. MBLB2868]|uniref:acetyltransferase n=1 Tax=Pontibacter sp. MBLB2868 TaxID=3451555 RepID=UPI003F74B992
MLRKKLVIFPFNGNGIEALDCISFAEYEFVGFVDDDSSKKSDMYDLYTRSFLKRYHDLYVLAVPGSSTSFRQRKDIISSLGIEKNRFVTAVHPKAFIGRNVKVGVNSLIMAGVVLTSNACINDHVVVLPNTVIHHDSMVGEYTLIGSNVVVAGGTTIGKCCYIGSGTNIINGISIGDASLIGLGSNIVRSVPKNAKMVGNPARNLNAYVGQEVV